MGCLLNGASQFWERRVGGNTILVVSSLKQRLLKIVTARGTHRLCYWSMHSLVDR